MACITEGSAGFPGFSERTVRDGTIAEVPNEHGWTRTHGKWHLTPADEVDLSVWRSSPAGSGFERY